MRNFKKHNCPICGKELVKLNNDDGISIFACDECDIEISIKDTKTDDDIVKNYIKIYHDNDNMMSDILRSEKCKGLTKDQIEYLLKYAGEDDLRLEDIIDINKSSQFEITEKIDIFGMAKFQFLNLPVTSPKFITIKYDIAEGIFTILKPGTGFVKLTIPYVINSYSNSFYGINPDVNKNHIRTIIDSAKYDESTNEATLEFHYEI